MMKTGIDRQALFGVAQAFSLWRFQSNADRGRAPVSQGAHSSPYLATEARRRVDTASLSPDQPQLFSEQPRA